jgi:hypothetical protein
MKIETRIYPFGDVTFKKIGTTGVINFRALYTIRSNKKNENGKFIYEPQFIDCKIWTPRDISNDIFKLTGSNGKEKINPLDVNGFLECETYTNKKGEKVVKPVLVIDNYSN